MAIINSREVLPRVFSHKFGDSPTAERKFVLTVDEPQSHSSLISAVGIVHGDTHPEHTYLYCVEGNITEPDRQHAEITYRYEAIPEEDFEPNPLSRPDVWQFSTGGAQCPFLYYYHGNDNNDVRPLINAAGDFIEGLTALSPELRATITGNRSAFPLNDAVAVTNAINSATYLGGAAYWWMCNGISGQQAVEVVNNQAIRYWQITVNLTFRRGGYVEQIPHVGFHYIHNGEKRRAWVFGSDGIDKIDAPTPQPLTSAGALKFPGANGQADLLLRRPYPVVNFSTYFGTPTF